jgi:hypothetical protein
MGQRLHWLPLLPLLLLLLSSRRVHALVAPNTSLATIPVAYFGGKGGRSGARSPTNIAMLAKMRIVMLEKWEGASVCLPIHPPVCPSGTQCVPAVRSSVCRPLVASGMKKRLSAGWSATLVICTLRPPERAGGLRASQAPAGTTASRTPPPSRHHCRANRAAAWRITALPC